jgi:hypothetical protein
MTVYSDLVSEYGDHAILYAAVLSIFFWIMFTSRYISSRRERSTWTKVMDVIFMFFYMALFVIYIAVGAMMGDSMFGSTAIGTCIGIGAYLVMFEILAYFKKKRTKV